MNFDDITKRFPRASASFIKANLDVDGVPPPPTTMKKGHPDYTPEENEKLTKYYADHAGQPIDLNEVAALMGRSRWSVAMQASRLGIAELDRPKAEAGIAKMAEAQREVANRPGVREQRAAATTKAWKTHPHPKGFLGHHRTPEEIAKMKAGSKRAWDDPKHRVNSEEYRQRISDKASAMMAARPKHNCYSYTKCGWRTIGGVRMFTRSRWEANYAHYLQWLKEHGEIQKWEYEPETFWFHKIKRGVRSYLPDFRVTANDGGVAYHEVKGWMNAKSKTKLKRMKKYYPDVAVFVFGDEWFRANRATLSKIVKGWEK